MSPPEADCSGMIASSVERYRVLVSDSIDDVGVRILEKVARVDKRTGLKESEICDIVKDYDAIMVRSATKVTAKIVEAGSKLKIIGRAGVGVDNVDVAAATERGIYVVNSPTGNIVAAAELTLGLMLSVARNISPADASVRDGKWERARFLGSQLQGKTLGIVGLGQVGSHVARVAREMGMRLLAYDPYVNEQKAKSLKCQVLTLDNLLAQSDFVSLHVPKLPETTKIINAKRLALMKPTAYLINCSRGGVVDEEALAEALKAGTIAGAALDVFEEENPFPEDHFLMSAPNLVVTPHLGASTREAQVNVAIDVANQIVETLHGNLPHSAVNLPGLRPAELGELGPLLNCCARLGRVAAQMLDGPLERIEVVAEGPYSTSPTDPLLLAVANGAIGVRLAENVNFVNVRQVADKYKIAIRGSCDPSMTKASILAELGSKTSVSIIRGTVSDDGTVLLKTFHNVPIFMPLPDNHNDNDCHMFYSKHQYANILSNTNILSNIPDLPGSLRNITTLLGSNGCNIAS
eukprot:Selendium_serpulae@DN5317_c0_g1_i1.p1